MDQRRARELTAEQSRALREQAERCRRLAGTIYDRDTNKRLGEMATDFERAAKELARKRR